MAPPSLLGPPEARPTTKSTLQSPSASSSSDPFINLMVTNFNKADLSDSDDQFPPMGLTENLSATYLSSGDPCLDFFFHLVPSTPADSLVERLHVSWAHNPLTTLKLICNLRGVRGTGKSDKKGFYTAALWLHSHHPKTLACNVPSLAEFGYFKDLPEILFRVLGLTRPGKTTKAGRVPARCPPWRRLRPFPMKKQKKNKKKSKKPIDVRIREGALRQEKEKEAATTLRHQKRAEMANNAVERYNRDPDFRFLHDRITDLFSECLRSDMEFFNAGRVNEISLAAKWCPSLDSSYDRATLLCEAIARKLFPKEKFPEYSEIEEAHYAYRVRDRLRKEVLVPLRKALELPEVFMSANRWDDLPYRRVASVAMKNYKKIFTKHDEERFNEYLESVKSGKAKIAAGALLPHEIIATAAAADYDNDDGGLVAELQWKRMVEDMAKEGKMTNCIAVCDVSGSMMGTPMEVCVALGLLLSELSDEPWKGKVITFSQNPGLHLIRGDDMRSKTEFIRAMDWGMNTNFQKVFDLILKVAVEGKLKEEQMIKRVFVFSDMEFDQASRNPWETDYKVIKKKFKDAGYGEVVPDIVFWNLRDSRSTPVKKNEKGVALVSGFSKNMMKMFMDGKEMHDPEAVMEAALSGDEYNKLVILD